MSTNMTLLGLVGVSPPQRVRVYDGDPVLFGKGVRALVEAWVRNTGHVVVTGDEPETLAIFMGIPNEDVKPSAAVPYIYVNSEQVEVLHGHPRARSMCRNAMAVWAMDAPDYMYMHRCFGVPEVSMAVVPLAMLGTILDAGDDDSKKTCGTDGGSTGGEACRDGAGGGGHAVGACRPEPPGESA